MPPARPRQRPLHNENDENSGSTRLTRAKAAALTVADEEANTGPTKKPLQTKKSSSTALSNAGPRKRAALGDVTNAGKGGESLDGKKAVSGKAGLSSKAAAQPAGVQKNARTSSSRSVLGPKDHNKKPQPSAAEAKRPGSGSGVLGNINKKRGPRSTSSQPSKEVTPNVEEEPPRKRSCTESDIRSHSKLGNLSPEEPTVAEAIQAVAADLDAEDLDDPLMVAEYVVEIFDYFRDLEEATLPNPDYISHQKELEWKMRGILVDWLVEVHTRFRLLPETLFLAVNIIDRFLSAKVVPLDKLQLVGTTAMFIAAKYEEVLSPHIGHFVHVADDGFNTDEILSAERYTLTTLNYDLSYPNPMNFLRRISKADGYDMQTRTIGKYLLEISLLDHRFMCYRQSHVAASAMYMARLILERGPWDATLAHYAGYTEEEIQPVFDLMLDYLHGPVTHEAFFKKYASKKFLKASILTRKWAKDFHAIHRDGAGIALEDVDDGK
ncbi:MAG: hypothetical protein Q9160_000981 [Pyrenula sp. 1 TL-2023]